ncbi:hypothetical protein [Oryza sativa Japonica Group]|uniref:DUF834 domain-containing protein n=2 Tax=Oryza sativa subsp. japonica TaxID=39947 RepID=Q5ZDB1_ORYSJ|nr:hypothetical protein [Oryza sativa Japonica Group]BAD53954.1 hypothetical protein [Oryza sativa Japonica Group]
MERGNGAETELARAAAKPAVEAAQHSGGGSGGGAWLEATAATERGALAGGRSSPESGGARERRGESAGLGKNGEMDEGSTGVVYMGAGEGDRGQDGRQRGGNGRRDGVATWARGGGKPAPIFAGRVGEKVEEEWVATTSARSDVRVGGRRRQF